MANLPTAPGAAILIEDLAKTYGKGPGGADGGEVRALDGMELSMREGEMVCLFGPNGSGKTSLLLIIAGLECPTSGRVEVKGKAPGQAKIGFVFQNYREALLPWRTCIENIAFPLELAGIAKPERDSRAKALVQALGLNIDLTSYPYQQSGGQQQLVAIARALIAEPDILVFDEPLSALDIKASLTMRGTIERIWLKSRIATLYVSHDADDAVFLADRIVLMSERPGRVLAVLDNPLPRPRAAVERSREFAELRARVVAPYSERVGQS